MGQEKKRNDQVAGEKGVPTECVGEPQTRTGKAYPEADRRHPLKPTPNKKLNEKRVKPLRLKSEPSPNFTPEHLKSTHTTYACV